MLSLPLKMEVTSWMRFSLWDWDETSHTDPVTKKPLLRHSFKQLVSSTWFLEQVWTVAPNPHKSSTMACLREWTQFQGSNQSAQILIAKVRNKEGSKYWLSQKERKNTKRKRKKKVTDPIPRVPPVTRAVIPMRDHLLVMLLSPTLVAISSVCFITIPQNATHLWLLYHSKVNSSVSIY